MPTTKQNALDRFLRWSERYTKTDMVYMIHSGFWMNLGSILVSLFSLGLYIIFARFVSPEIYGTYQYLLSAGALIGAFSLTGMNSAVTRAVAQGHEGVLRRSVRMQLLWGVIPLSISLLVALYYGIHGNILLAAGFALTAFFMPLNNALNTYGAYLTGKKDFRSAFFYTISFSVVFYGSMASVARFAPSILILIGTNLIVQSIGLYLCYRAVVETHHLPNTDDGEALTYGTHLSLMSVFGAFAAQADSLLAFHFVGPAALAVYAFASAIPDRIATLFKFIPASLLPKLSEQNDAQIRRAVGLSRMLWIVGALFLCAVAYALCAPLIFHLLFPTYLAAVPYSQIYALSMFVIVGSILSTALTAQKRIKALWTLNLIVPAVQLLLQCSGVIWFGLWGLVLAKIASSWVLILVAGILLFFTRGDHDQDITYQRSH